MRALFLSIALWLLIPATSAGIPDAFQPIVVEPPFSPTERVIDLTTAVHKARANRKPILIYMGAQDCPPCNRYEAFLRDNAAELVPVYNGLNVVEVRSWLRGPKLLFRVGTQQYTLDEFRAAVGDTGKVFTWPYFWMISSDLRQVKPMPRGSKNYLDLERHKALMRAERR